MQMLKYLGLQSPSHFGRLDTPEVRMPKCLSEGCSRTSRAHRPHRPHCFHLLCSCGCLNTRARYDRHCSQPPEFWIVLLVPRREAIPRMQPKKKQCWLTSWGCFGILDVVVVGIEDRRWSIMRGCIEGCTWHERSDGDHKVWRTAHAGIRPPSRRRLLDPSRAAKLPCCGWWLMCIKEQHVLLLAHRTGGRM